MTDLITRLLAELDRREALALAAHAGPWCSWADIQDPLEYPRSGVATADRYWVAGSDEADAAHMVVNDPTTALRLIDWPIAVALILVIVVIRAAPKGGDQ